MKPLLQVTPAVKGALEPKQPVCGHDEAVAWQSVRSTCCPTPPKNAVSRQMHDQENVREWAVVQVDTLMTLRKQINEALAASGGGKLSVNDFIVKASALVWTPLTCRQAASARPTLSPIELRLVFEVGI